MTDLREFTTGKVECNPHDATRPSVTITVKADAKAEVALTLYWVDGRAVAKWKVGGQNEPAGNGGYFTLNFSLGPIEGDEWKTAKPKSEAATPAPTFPRPTEVIAQLLPLAVSWEASPIRSADRLMRAVSLTLVGQTATQEAA